MALHSTFQIVLTGNKRQGRKFDVLTEWIKKTVRKLDPNVRVVVRTFMDLGYRSTMLGKPVLFEEVDDVQRILVRYAKAYLTGWELKLMIKLEEKY